VGRAGDVEQIGSAADGEAASFSMGPLLPVAIGLGHGRMRQDGDAGLARAILAATVAAAAAGHGGCRGPRRMR
jgi:hypothetical protein